MNGFDKSIIPKELRPTADRIEACGICLAKRKENLDVFKKILEYMQDFANTWKPFSPEKLKEIDEILREYHCDEFKEVLDALGSLTSEIFYKDYGKIPEELLPSANRLVACLFCLYSKNVPYEDILKYNDEVLNNRIPLSEEKLKVVDEKLRQYNCNELEKVLETLGPLASEIFNSKI
jgi:hypothetical protein